MADEDKDSTKTVALKLDLQAARKLRILAAEQDSSVPSLIHEAINYWWEAKGHKETRGDLNEVKTAQ